MCSPKTTKWAILIGTNYLPASNEREPETVFRGCVADVERMSEHLCLNQGFQKQNILKFISRHPDDRSGIAHNSHQDATYRNVRRGFDLICARGNPGDIVYIHFSGLIRSVPTLLPAWSGRLSDKGFGLLDDAIGRRFIHDLELALLLAGLSRKRLEVTVFLDCRKHDYSAVHETASQSEFSQEELLSVFHGVFSPRDRDTWLLNPDPASPHVLLTLGYIDGQRVLQEHLDTQSQEHHGTLTYLSLIILRENNGPNITYDELIRQLGLMTDHRFGYIPIYSEATVMYAGNTEKLFLGGMDAPRTIGYPLHFPAILIINSSGVRLHVLGGRAQGVCDGDEVHFTRGTYLENSPKALVYFSGLLFEIYMVDELSSSAKPVGSSEEEQGDSLTDDTIEKTYIKVHGVARFVKIRHQNLSNEEHAALYSTRLLLIGKSKELASHCNVRAVGAFRYHNPGRQISTRSPTLTSDGSLHLLSGDCATIIFSTAVKETLYLDILCFDSTFGITHVYPKTPREYLATRLQMENAHVSFDVRFSFPIQKMDDAECHQVTEILKIFVSTRQESFYPLELRPIGDRAFLTANRDPAAKISLATPPTGFGPWFMDARGINSEEKVPYEKYELEDPVEEIWYCFNIKVVIHKTAESLAMI
ncbi:hypothetical protein MGYG_05710 [Nannizzia gypsea CBS 118893]|uniref:Uncharacterized protein n=1 Tax=Arthroderma gypseum (strain ATCC MYA-4604 / CBS 118893) TaxID=535722 RepID=E4UXH8_ARTGP|nr:hypothetical protein MGYG_05710 [Nannizzia gypsea CBS 118893]EFR02712.1 hypothetical protein MGYG_05710 [Nannizzia gypsea CBS 118893]